MVSILCNRTPLLFDLSFLIQSRGNSKRLGKQSFSYLMKFWGWHIKTADRFTCLCSCKIMRLVKLAEQLLCGKSNINSLNKEFQKVMNIFFRDICICKIFFWLIFKNTEYCIKYKNTGKFLHMFNKNRK